MVNYNYKAICIASVIGLLCTSSSLHAEENSTVSKTIAGTTKEYLSDPARTGSLVGSIIAGSAVANPLAPVLGSVVGFVVGKSSAFSKKRNNSERSNTYNNRSLMPTDGTEITGLSGLSGHSSLTGSPIDSATTPADVGTTTAISEGQSRREGHDATSGPGVSTTQTAMADSPVSGIVIVEEMGQSPITTRLDTIVPTDLVREAEMGLHSAPSPNDELRLESAGASDLQKQLADACNNYATVKTASLNCYYRAQ